MRSTVCNHDLSSFPCLQFSPQNQEVMQDRLLLASGYTPHAESVPVVRLKLTSITPEAFWYTKAQLGSHGSSPL
jgi:hypothetical protein